MCLNKRDRTQLYANLWRSKNALSRNSRPLGLACIVPLICVGIVIVMKLYFVGPVQYNIYPFDQYAVVSSETNPTNYWVDGNETQGLNTTLTLQNCTDWGWTRVGLIKPEGLEHNDGNIALDNIFEKINASYSHNWEGNHTLDLIVFPDDANLTSYVKSLDYADHGLCFALGWNQFNVLNWTFDIDLRWNPA